MHVGNIDQKQYLKYLGMYIDKHNTSEQQIKYVKTKIAKNSGILNKLRYYLDLNILQQLCLILIYPYKNYGFIRKYMHAATPRLS
jgi:hypothetical protein